MTSRTFFLVSSEKRPLLLITLETVATETPQSFAISLIDIWFFFIWYHSLLQG